MKKIIRAKGFSFLEILVISGIIAAISVSTYSYMSSTQRSVRISRIVQDIQSIRAASNNWATGRTSFFTGVSMSKVAHLLPPALAGSTPIKAGISASPWQGNYTVAKHGSNDTLFVITVSKVPTNVGPALVDRLNSSQIVASYAGTTLIVTYE